PKTKQVADESKLCEQGRNFCNKMWNALRLIKGWSVKPGQGDAVNRLAVQWMEHKLNLTLERLEKQYETFRFSESIMDIYKLLWGDFCSWYLEMIKPDYGEPIDEETLEATIGIYEQLMTVLHPFMPFVTEEIWHHLRERKDGEDCVVSAYPKAAAYDTGMIEKVEQAKSIVASVREVRNNKGIKMKEALKLFAQEGEDSKALLQLEGLQPMIVKMANLESLALTGEEVPNAVSFLSGQSKFFLELQEEIDTAAECARLREELEYQKGFVNMVEKKLSNQGFVNNAPAPVVERERMKLADGQAKIKNLEEELGSMGC
ncbi:MAG: class I tRNA ligase family protein, partial [Bacteroidetes bacterium]|nr:class I tRNA ligase family protein [Bacteroidota bacterium]